MHMLVERGLMVAQIYILRTFKVAIALLGVLFINFSQLSAQQEWSQLTNPKLYCVTPEGGGLEQSLLVRVVSEVDHRVVPFRRFLRFNRARLRSLRFQAQSARGVARRRLFIERRQRQRLLRQEVLICRDSGGPCNVIGDTSHSSLYARIINGNRCGQVGNSPVVELEVEWSSGYSSCTGNVISPTRVLTAAHCVADGAQRAVAATVIAGGTQSFEVVEYVVHPSNQGGNVGPHDLAILKLDHELPTRVLRTIDVDSQYQSQETMIIAGYGLIGTAQAGGFSNGLYAGKMRLSRATTEEILALFNHFSDGPDWSNTCRGDSGGPLLVLRNGEWVLAGITSYGEVFQCGPTDESGFVNLKSPSNIEFINSHVPDLPE